MPKVAFMTLGCKVNQYETETLAGLFTKAGYEIVDFTEQADVYIINTCSVTNIGEKKSRQIIRRAKRLNEEAIIVVTGCYAQLAPEQIATIKGVRLIVGTQERQDIVNLVEQARDEKKVITKVKNIMTAKTFEDIPLFSAPQRTRAFLKIQEGCDNYCSFCIIPYVRGHLRSRSLASIRREVKNLLQRGFQEIVLTGIHLGAYGKDLKPKLTLFDAVRAVLDFKEVKRLRLGSLESIEVSDELLHLLKTEARFAKHLHLPLQAGSDKILHLMHRHYDTATFYKLITKIENYIPNIGISTDIIVGFPGETEVLFKESLSFVQKMNFVKVHIFPYSKRDGTPAAKMEGQVLESVKKERMKRMQKVADERATYFKQKFLNTEVSILFEENKKGIHSGLAENYLRVYTDDKIEPFTFTKMKLEKLYLDGIWGKIAD